MNKLTKATHTSPVKFSVAGRFLLVAVCLVIIWLGFWAYAVLADVPATSLVATETDTLSRPSAPNEVRTRTTAATMRIDPVNSSVKAGQTFTITVMIDNVTGLGAFQFSLNYNTSIVHVKGVTGGPFLGSTGGTVQELGPTIDNALGLTSYGALLLPPATGPSGSGTLASIKLEAKGLGTTPLNLQSVQIFDTSGNALAVNVQGGQVEVTGTEPEPTNYFVYLPIVLRNY